MATSKASTKREKPGSSGEGDFYHIEVRPSSGFKTFRNQDVGEKGGIERVAGKRESGTWDTVKWLVEKDLAHIEKGRLVADSEDAKKLFEDLGSVPTHVEGDRFEAKATPVKHKPTPAQTKARRENIKKAQAARHK